MRSIMALAAAAGLTAGLAFSAPAFAQCAGQPGDVGGGGGLTGTNTPGSCAPDWTYNNPNWGYNNGSDWSYNNGWNAPADNDYGYYPAAPDDEYGYYPGYGYDYGYGPGYGFDYGYNEGGYYPGGPGYYRGGHNADRHANGGYDRGGHFAQHRQMTEGRAAAIDRPETRGGGAVGGRAEMRGGHAGMQGGGGAHAGGGQRPH